MSIDWHNICDSRTQFAIRDGSFGMFEFVYNYVEKDDLIKYLRLVVIVSFYLAIRQYYTKWAQTKALQRQLADDEREKKEKPSKDEQKKLEQEKKLKAEAANFGWGKKTRRDVKLQEAELVAQAETLRQRHQTAYDAAEDHDIEDLLED